MPITEDVFSEIQLVQDTFPFLGDVVAKIARVRVNPSLGALSGVLCSFAIETKHLKTDGKRLIALDEVEHAPGGRHVAAHPGLLLGEVLRDFRMRYGTNPVLAYILAKAVWHYYDSDWMNIAAGRPVNTTGDPNDWDPKTTNERLMTLMSIVNSATFEGDYKYPRYRMVVEKCLDPGLFKNAPFRLHKPLENLEERRSIIHDEIVDPLRQLVEGTGWHVEFDEMERTPFMPKGEPGSPSIRQFSVTTVNEIAKPLSAPTLGKSDEHGTHLTTLLLRVAPSAEIYVARVADNSRGLASAEGNISQASINFAIRIAAVQWDVDFISMSFGLAKHVAEIRDAIRDATHHKRGRITFFAAAANDGLNRREMFPANFGDPVISVRGTNRSGAFEPDFNPATSASGPAFGTLGKDVYLDWIDEEGRRCISECSVATPIGVGIACMVLEYTAYRAAEFQPGDLALLGNVRANHSGVAGGCSSAFTPRIARCSASRLLDLHAPGRVACGSPLPASRAWPASARQVALGVDLDHKGLCACQRSPARGEPVGRCADAPGNWGQDERQADPRRECQVLYVVAPHRVLRRRPQRRRLGGAAVGARGAGHDTPQPLDADAALSHHRHQGCRGLLGVEQPHRATRLGSRGGRARHRAAGRVGEPGGVYG
ncbi:hypothetical protein G3M48_005932 [Beauveria asiatica]|uniref:Peptidase S8/S53 domain-containing protein n=1 Tax=Beauveria asiatica TaxID=1069075 RepID=A0AAW0RQM8_9HYPO